VLHKNTLFQWRSSQSVMWNSCRNWNYSWCHSTMHRNALFPHLFFWRWCTAPPTLHHKWEGEGWRADPSPLLPRPARAIRDFLDTAHVINWIIIIIIMPHRPYYVRT